MPIQHKTFFTVLPSFILLANIAAAASLEQSPIDISSLDAEAQKITTEFAKSLLATVQAAVSSGDTVQGISICQVIAPAIASQYSLDGWKVGRTSLKFRASNNRPDAWERAVLEKFATDSATTPGVAPSPVSQITGASYRYMRPIVVKQPCLACHGSAIGKDTQAELRKRYPDDSATGYALGDIRGAFTLTKQLTIAPGGL